MLAIKSKSCKMKYCCYPIHSYFTGVLYPTPRSRSIDNLEKYSPTFTRKATSDTASPLTRRLTGDSLMSQGSSDGSIATETNIPVEHSSSTSSIAKGFSTDGSKNGWFLITRKSTICDSSIADDTDSLKHFKLKSTPTPTVKQRPWSMVSSEHKSGDLSLLSDGTSPITSTGNTPDSGDALDSSESSSIDKRITKDLKAKKTGIFV